MKKNKLISFALSLCLTVGLVPSIVANAAVKDTRTTIESSQEIKDREKSTTIETEGTIITIPTKPNSEIKTSGLKKKAVVFALKNGGKALGKIVGKIGDKKIGRMLEENAFEIGCFLDTLSADIEQNLIDFMIFDLHLPQSASRIIAWTLCQLFL